MRYLRMVGICMRKALNLHPLIASRQCCGKINQNSFDCFTPISTSVCHAPSNVRELPARFRPDREPSRKRDPIDHRLTFRILHIGLDDPAGGRRNCSSHCLNCMSGAQPKWARTENHKVTILFFPHRARVSGILPAMSQQHRSVPSDIAKWLIFKTRKVAGGNWQVRARLGSRDESHYVDSFNSEGQALEWIASNQSDDWLKEHATHPRRRLN